MAQVHQAVTRLLKSAYRKAKRKHTRPITWRELRALPYRDYLQTGHWQKMRIDALKRASYECQECGAIHGELHVHHITYKRLGRERLRDLRVLCADCHGEVHGR